MVTFPSDMVLRACTVCASGLFGSPASSSSHPREQSGKKLRSFVLYVRSLQSNDGEKLRMDERTRVVKALGLRPCWSLSKILLQKLTDIQKTDGCLSVRLSESIFTRKSARVATFELPSNGASLRCSASLKAPAQYTSTSS